MGYHHEIVGKFINIIDGTLSWTDANNYCQSVFGTTLATINSATENNNACFNAGHCWIGLRRETKYGAFKWVGKHQSTYKNFNTGEPNNSGWNEACVHQDSGTRKWNDRSCSTKFKFSCNSPWYLGTSVTNFQGAINFCGVNELGSVTNAVQKALLLEMQKKTSNKDAWLGFYRPGSVLTDFRWLDGSTRDYTNWAANQPNNGNDDCAEQLVSNGQWTDIPCGNALQVPVCNSKYRDVACNDCAGMYVY